MAKKQETAITNWDAELAKEATQAVTQEKNTSVGAWLKTSQATLKLPGGVAAPNNQLAVVVLDSLIEYQYYVGRYNPDDPSPPKCFAFGRDEDELAPHEVVVKAGNQEHDTCAGCPQNEWGTADTGRGKACKNIRRLALIIAGHFGQDGKQKFEAYDAQTLADESPLLLKVPVMSVKNYAQYVRSLNDTLKRPPYGMYTRLSVTPDPKSQFVICFDALGKIEDTHRNAVVKHRQAVQSMLTNPHMAFEAKQKPKGAPTKRNF